MNFVIQSNKEKRGVKKSIIIWAALGALGISLIFYLVQVLGMQSFTAPFYFMAGKWYFVLPLVLGFGVQAGLFRAIRLKAKQGGAAVAAAGGVSTGSMAACCLHNFVGALPILGLSGLVTFFSVYQNYVFGFSILFVVGGIMYMWGKYMDITL